MKIVILVWGAFTLFAGIIGCLMALFLKQHSPLILGVVCLFIAAIEITFGLLVED